MTKTSKVGQRDFSLEITQRDFIERKTGLWSTYEGVDNSSISVTWTNLVHKIQQPFENSILYIATTSAQKPRLTIALAICISFLVLLVGLVTNFELNVDTDLVWAPFNSAPRQHEKWIENESGFPPNPRLLTLLFHEGNTNGNNTLLLRKKSVNQVFIAVDLVRNMTEYQSLCSFDDDDIIYMDIPHTQSCRVEGIVRFWNESYSVFRDQVQSDQSTVKQLSSYYLPDGTPVPQDIFFGKPARDAEGLLTSVQVYEINFQFPQGLEAESFESKAVKRLLKLRDEWRSNKENLHLEVNGERSLAEESVRAVLEDITLVPIVFVIMILFTCFVFFEKDQVRSRMLLGCGAVVSVLLSMMAGYGTMFILGVPLTPLTQVMPYIVFGIGLDDAFILRGAYLQTDSSKDTTERIRETIRAVGLSIFLTTITSSLAFAFGCVSTIPIVFWLCLYAVPTILMVLIYQLTFFVACIVLDETRVRRGRRDCLLCIDARLQEEGERDLVQQETMSVTEKIIAKYAEHIIQPKVKAVVVVVFTALFGACCYSTSKMTHKFKPDDMLPPRSYGSDFLNTLYGGGLSLRPIGVYFRFMNQSDLNVHQQMMSYVNDLKSIDAISRKPTYFWVRDFQTFTNVTRQHYYEFSFVDRLDAFLSSDVYRNLYNRDIVRDLDGTITSSRCWMSMDNITLTNVHTSIRAYRDQLVITSLQSINEDIDSREWLLFSYSTNYLTISFLSVLVDEFIRTTLLAIGAVTAVTLLFISHWTAVVFTVPLLLLLYIDLIGLMQIAGIHINMLSYITTLLSIGLLVDFIIHVLLRFYEVHGTRTEKITRTLKTLGPSIFTAGVSTILGTLPLAFASGGIFRTIFVSFVSLVALGLTHGLILLPVVLATFGPETTVLMEKNQAQQDAVRGVSTGRDEPEDFNDSRLSI